MEVLSEQETVTFNLLPRENRGELNFLNAFMIGKALIFAVAPSCTLKSITHKLWICRDGGASLVLMFQSYVLLLLSVYKPALLHRTNLFVFLLGFTVYWYPVGYLQANLSCSVHTACELPPSFVIMSR